MHTNIQYRLNKITDLPHPYNKIGDGPEGPEARSMADKLKITLTNKVIISLNKDERGKWKGLELIKTPSYITNVYSYGKKIIIDIRYNSEMYVIIVSLGMGGRFQYNPGKHSHIYLTVAEYKTNGCLNVIDPGSSFNLYFEDKRYMGHFNVVRYSEIGVYFKDMGPDLLQAALNESTYITLERWQNIFNIKKVKKWKICKALMDQSLLAGIGNYIKSEVLYYSRIHPERIVETLTIDEMDRLRINCHKIIMFSYSNGGFSTVPFISPDSSWGKYPYVVYHKEFDPCGNPVITGKTSDGRTSYWVPSIQLL